MNSQKILLDFINNLEILQKLIGTIVLLILLSVLVILTLIKKQNYLDLQKEILSEKEIKKVQKGEVCTEYYNHKDSYLFYCEIDRIANKSKVYMVKVISNFYMCIVHGSNLCNTLERAKCMALLLVYYLFLEILIVMQRIRGNH